MYAYRTTTNTARHPFLTGVSAVVAVLSLGMASGYALGFDLPAIAYAQVAPPTVTPVIVTPILPLAPPPPPVITVPIPTPVLVSPITVTGPAQTGTPPTPPTNGPSTNTVTAVTVTAPTPGNPFTPPCCATPGGPGPTVAPVTVTAPITANPFTPPCCQVPSTPSSPPVPPVAPPPPFVPPIVTPPPTTPPPVVPPPTTPPPGPGPSPACLILEATPNLINPGDAVTLRYGTQNATSASIDQGVGALNPPTSGTVVVHPASVITYTLTVPGAPSNAACQATIRFITSTTTPPVGTTTPPVGTTTPPGGPGTTTPPSPGGGGGGCVSGCGGGGGGGGGSPSVLLSATPHPLASVYLSQIPYTGLDLGPVGTALYWLTLLLWSGAAAYLILFGAMPFALKKTKIFGASVQAVLNAQPPAATAAAVASVAARPAPPPPPAPPANPPPVMAAAPAPSPVRPTPAREGFRAFAASNGALTIEDIVKGLSRESGMVFEQSAMPSSFAPAPARMPQPTEGVTPAPAPVAEPQPSPAPAAPAAYPQEVPAFIATLLAGDRDALFAMLRAIARSGADTQEFLAQAALAVDDAYRAHVEGTPVHPEIARITESCHPAFLEKLVAALATAVDSSYSSGVTGTKLALTRALAIVNG